MPRKSPWDRQRLTGLLGWLVLALYAGMIVVASYLDRPLRWPRW